MFFDIWTYKFTNEFAFTKSQFYLLFSAAECH